MKTNSALQQNVLDELKWEPMVDHSQIGVTAKEGVITLTGFVPNYAQKAAAEKAVRRVMGVRAIAEEIEVRFGSAPKTSDAEIAERILDILRWDVFVRDQKIDVKVEHGWVTLSGEVEWNYQKESAKTFAGRITGVRGVTNLTTVQARTSAYDVRERITAAFKRSSTLDSSAINIAITGGTVKLSGRVHGWNERKVAENAAWAAPGVTKVEDDIVFA